MPNLQQISKGKGKDHMTHMRAEVQLQPIPNLAARRDGCLTTRFGRFVPQKDLAYLGGRVWEKSEPGSDSFPGPSSLQSAAMYKISIMCGDDKHRDITPGFDKIRDYTSNY